MDSETQWWASSSANNLCHYTSAESLVKILEQSALRLGPFKESNDPYEFEDWLPSAVMGKGARTVADTLIADIWQIQRRVNRVAFAMDGVNGPPSHGCIDVCHRGFGSLPMWAHYADHFRGGCLVFDRGRLVELATAMLKPTSEAFYCERVSYEDDVLFGPSSPITDTGSGYLAKNAAELMFRKRAQWSYEHEFRIVAVAPVEGSQILEYGDSLVGVIVGVKSPLNHYDVGKRYGVRAQGQMFSSGVQTIY
ncbi:MAG TPA: DUF2971 domain-containing protein [Candidatus Krumholzibacteria bacterium]|nr:DUF2971 domain-containing protein [Candidatus Krumholzibacteria bacterium]